MCVITNNDKSGYAPDPVIVHAASKTIDEALIPLFIVDPLRLFSVCSIFLVSLLCVFFGIPPTLQAGSRVRPICGCFSRVFPRARGGQGAIRAPAIRSQHSVAQPIPWVMTPRQITRNKKERKKKERKKKEVGENREVGREAGGVGGGGGLFLSIHREFGFLFWVPFLFCSIYI